MRFLVLISAAFLLYGCASRDEAPGAPGGPGGPPPKGDSYDAPPPPADAPEGASKLLGGGDNDPGFPPDAHEFVTGNILRGTVRKGEGLAPMKGFEVSEYGDKAPQTTGDDGVFKLELTNQKLPAIHVVGEGHVPTIQISSDKSRLYFDGEYKIEVFELEDEKEVLQSDFGVAWSDVRGQLVVNLQPMGSPKGVTVSIDPKGESWIYGPDDTPKKGSTLPKDDSGAGEVVYPSLEPGSYAITVTAPKELDCSGPAEVPVVAGTYTRAYFFCIEEGKDPQTATSDPTDYQTDKAAAGSENAGTEGEEPATPDPSATPPRPPPPSGEEYATPAPGEDKSAPTPD